MKKMNPVVNLRKAVQVKQTSWRQYDASSTIQEVVSVLNILLEWLKMKYAMGPT